ncbi:MAG: flagellar M-ring protein FliF, partial [Alphaproteobacteria bacterium]|nr:flagellar M-ring protein FliF [Alphaproteobacteria bacterium]
FVATLQQLGAARLGVMGAIVLGLLTFFVFLSMRITSPEMKLLYTDLSTTDSGSVAAKLEETEITYEISSDGSRILVPSNEVGRARMLLAAAGLPNGGSMGYEIFDKQSGFGTTNFVQNINQVRALEGELSKTISSMDSIRSARVHIVLPQRELFSRESRSSSASVFLGIQTNSAIERQQIAAIQSLVASAIPNLKANNVSIIDSNGNLMAKGGEEEESLLSLKTEDLRRNFETRMQRNIEEQISRIVGYGKVTAIVNAEMNFDQIRMNEELYSPEGQVLRSSQTTQEDSSESEAGSSNNVGIENNLPGISGDLLGDGGPSAQNSRSEEVTNYEISKTIRNTIRQSGQVKKLSLSVLVDGRYEQDEEGNKTYNPRSQEEMGQISALVRTAVGFDEDRGDVIEIVNLQFAQIETEEGEVEDDTLLGFEKSDLLDAAEMLVVAVMLILVVLLILQPMVSKLVNIDSSTGKHSSLDDLLHHDLLSASPANPALAPPSSSAQAIGVDGQTLSANQSYQLDDDDDDSLINLEGIEGKVKASTVKKVEEIVENYPAEAVSVVRSWLDEEG